MIRVCSGFPPEMPVGQRERFVSAHGLYWHPSIQLVADELAQGGALDRYRLIIPAATADDMEDGDLLAWLDPDIETLSAVPSYMIPQLIKDADLCFIGQAAGGTDLGFWAARLSPASRRFLRELAESALSGQSAADAWADARELVQLVERDLTPGGSGDTWARGPLGRYSRRGQPGE